MGVRAAALAVVALLGAGALHAQGDGPAAAADPARAGVRPGDVINVWVWREPDLTGEFVVDARGLVVLPMLGERRVAGRAADSLADDLRAAFGRYIINPIRITVLRRITISGQVQRPGLYPVDATVTIGGAIALAGGLSGGGDARRVQVRRGGQVLLTTVGPETVLERSPVQSGDVIFVPERSWWSRNLPSVLVGVGSAIASGVAVALLAR
jgi:protein involved in polysaccharide export with SLBB domain